MKRFFRIARLVTLWGGIFTASTRGADFDSMSVLGGLSVSGSIYTSGISVNDWEFGHNGPLIIDEGNYEGGGIFENSDGTLNSLEVYGSVLWQTNYSSSGDWSSETYLGFSSWWNGSANWDGIALTFQTAGTNATVSNITHVASLPEVYWTYFPDANGSYMEVSPHGALDVGDATSLQSVISSPEDLSLQLYGDNDFNFVLSLKNHTGTLSPVFSTSFLSHGDSYAISLDVSNTTQPVLSLGGVIITGNMANSGLYFHDGVVSTDLAIDPANQRITFTNGFSLGGNNTKATLQLGGGLAVGNSSTATGSASLAFGSGSASGASALAFGNGTLASGAGALALGGGNASATAAFAIGTSARASGQSSVAIGPGVVALTANTAAAGHYNTSISSTGNVTLDPAFIVGTGASSGATSNGFVLYNNGNVTITGMVSLGQAVDIRGAAFFNGSVTITGNATLSQAPGNLTMGAFGN